MSHQRMRSNGMASGAASLSPAELPLALPSEGIPHLQRIALRIARLELDFARRRNALPVDVAFAIEQFIVLNKSLLESARASAAEAR